MALARNAQKKKGAQEPHSQEGKPGVGTQVPQGEVPEPFRTKRGVGTFLLDMCPEEP